MDDEVVHGVVMICRASRAQSLSTVDSGRSAPVALTVCKANQGLGYVLLILRRTEVVVKDSLSRSVRDNWVAGRVLPPSESEHADRKIAGDGATCVLVAFHAAHLC
jgi:hypothetical protein